MKTKMVYEAPEMESVKIRYGESILSVSGPDQISSSSIIGGEEGEEW